MARLVHGYYWMQAKGAEPEVVLIDGREQLWRCGSDVVCLLSDGKWWERGEVLELVFLRRIPLKCPFH